MPELDVGALLAVLHRHEVRFILIGGMAGVVHGSPFPTEDVDITPEATDQNLARLSRALNELDARIRTEDEPLVFAHDAESLKRITLLNLTTRAGDLDISLTPSGTSGYNDLIRDAQQLVLFDIPVSVASLADVIRSKQAANRPKDERVLPALRDLLASRYER